MDNRIDSEIKNKYKKDLKQNQMNMKMRNKELKDAFKELDSRTTTPDDEDGDEFTDTRVYELWALAKKANMSQDELSSFKVS